MRRENAYFILYDIPGSTLTIVKDGDDLSAGIFKATIRDGSGFEILEVRDSNDRMLWKKLHKESNKWIRKNSKSLDDDELE